MSTYIAGFDGHTCCNCGDVRPAHSPAGACPGPAHAHAERGAPNAEQAASYLARALLALVERERWWLAEPLHQCRACGFNRGAGHHPACRYAVLFAQITGLAPPNLGGSGVPVPPGATP